MELADGLSQSGSFADNLAQALPALLACVRTCPRFVDDVQAIGSVALPHLLCENQQLRDTGIMGIYPEACPLENRPPRSDTEADFLDIKQMFQRGAALGAYRSSRRYIGCDNTVV
jgi:hypothetical protein